MPLWTWSSCGGGCGDRPAPAPRRGRAVGLGGVALIFLPGGSGETDLGVAALAVLAALSWAVGSLLVTLRPVPATR